MSNYTIAVAWSGKDNLADSDANKVISGADFNTEFTAVQTAVNTKADLNGSASEAFSATTASADTNTTQVATTAYVQTEIGAGKNGHGDRTVSTSAASGGSNGDIWYQVAS
jgi:cytoskeletal protein RodZ